MPVIAEVGSQVFSFSLPNFPKVVSVYVAADDVGWVLQELTIIYTQQKLVDNGVQTRHFFLSE